MSTQALQAANGDACRVGFFLLTLLMVLLVGRAAGAGPETPLLSQVNIAAIATDSERLYVGGFDAGLYVVEADGRTTHVESPAVSPHINALLWSAADETLWLGTARGVTRCRWTKQPGIASKPGAPEVPSDAVTDAGRPQCAKLGASKAVHALLLLDDGTLVAGGDAGLAFVTDGEITDFGPKQGAPFRSVWALAQGPDGVLFVGSTQGLYWGERRDFLTRQPRLRRASLVSGELPDDWVTALLFDAGELYVGTYNSGVVSFDVAPTQLAPSAMDSVLGYVNPAGLVRGGEGQVLVATMDGLHGGRLTQTRLQATQARDVTAVVSDRRGGYWVGTRGGLEHIAGFGVSP